MSEPNEMGKKLLWDLDNVVGVWQTYEAGALKLLSAYRESIEAPLKARIEELEAIVSDMKDNKADDDAILKFQKRRLQIQHDEINRLEAELAAALDAEKGEPS